MTCDHCVKSVSDALYKLNGITKVDVSLKDQLVTVEGVGKPRFYFLAVVISFFHMRKRRRAQLNSLVGSYEPKVVEELAYLQMSLAIKSYLLTGGANEFSCAVRNRQHHRRNRPRRHIARIGRIRQ